MASNNKIQLVFVVNGTPVTDGVNVNQPLHSVLGSVLSKAGVAGDADPSRWEFNFNNAVLDATKKTGEFGFPANAQVFVNMKAGVAG